MHGGALIKRTILLILIAVSLGFSSTFAYLLPADLVKITVAYDNRTNNDLKSDWGFSVYIEGADKNVLFDTAMNGSILQRNIKALGIGVKSIDSVVLSHNNDDHTGGLRTIVMMNRNIDLYIIPVFKDNVRTLSSPVKLDVNIIEIKGESIARGIL